LLFAVAQPGAQAQGRFQFLRERPELQILRTFKDPALDAAFQNKQGWTGADDAYSFSVTYDRTLWIFADTFIGKIDGDKRLSATMIHSSAAFQKLRTSPPKLDFLYCQSAGKPKDLFLPTDKGTYYWPGSGTTIDGTLFLFLKKIRPTKSGPPEFRFDWFAD